MRRGTLGATIAGLGLVAAAGWGLTGIGASEPDPAPAPRVHLDPRAMERGMLDAMEALMRDDVAGVGAAVKTIGAGCRELHAEDDDVLGDGFRQLDQALHLVLRGTRSFAADGDADEAFTEFVWVLRTCRQCHAHAREHGHLPADGPLWERAKARTKPAETAHSER